MKFHITNVYNLAISLREEEEEEEEGKDNKNEIK